MVSSTSSFYNPYSLYPTSPSQYGYSSIALTNDFIFAWPENNSDSQYTIAQQMYVNTTNVNNKFIFPPANLVGTGRTFQIYNFGVLAFTVYDNSGVISLATINPGQLYQCTVIDNSISAGIWKVLLLGTGSSGANADALSGYGLSSLTNSKINTNLPEIVITGAYTVQSSDRGSILSYIGGTNTMTLPLPVDGFIVGVINNSKVGGLLTIQAPLGFTINNSSNLSLAPGDSTFITGGINYNAIGIGRLNFGTNSLLGLDVSASINITLTSAQSSNNIIIFSGTLSKNINVYFSPVQVNKYDIYNNTIGGFSITVSILGGMNTFILRDQERYAYFTDTSELYNVPSNSSFPTLATFWVSNSNSSLPNQVNLGELSNGLIGINVAASSATPYTIPIYNDVISNNLFFGTNSVPLPLPTGEHNTIIGINTGNMISTGGGNTAVGNYSLTSNTTGESNTAIGFESLKSNTIGGANTAVGSFALYSNTTGVDNVAVGFESLNVNTTGGGNTAVGVSSLASNTTGESNTAVGFESLKSNTTGGGNTAVGNYSLTLNTTGLDNVAIGFESLKSNTTGGANIAVGNFSLTSNTTGINNVAVGFESLNVNTTGGGNTAVGVSSLASNITGENNVAIGFESLKSNTIGTENIAIGVSNLKLNTTGENNVAIGFESLNENTTGKGNTVVGNFSLTSNTTGENNVAIGFGTLNVNTIGGTNVVIGAFAGNSFDNNNKCIFIGDNSGSTVGNLINAIAIGSSAQVSNSDTMILGARGTAVAVNTLANLVVTANSQSNGTVGTATLNGTTNVTVSTTACKTTSLIIPIHLTNPTLEHIGIVSVNNITNGSFNIVSTNALDNSICQWFVVNPV
jgi:hypothetical protein